MIIAKKILRLFLKTSSSILDRQNFSETSTSVDSYQQKFSVFISDQKESLQKRIVFCQRLNFQL